MQNSPNEQKVGIWLDHKKAFFVFIKSGEVTTKVLDSEVGPHARYSHNAAYPTAKGPQSGGGEKKYVERNRQELEKYYDQVIKEIGQSKEIFICGPGEAKTELNSRISRTHGLAERVVGVATADSITDAQIVAKVKSYFGIPL